MRRCSRLNATAGDLRRLTPIGGCRPGCLDLLQIPPRTSVEEMFHLPVTLFGPCELTAPHRSLGVRPPRCSTPSVCQTGESGAVQAARRCDHGETVSERTRPSSRCWSVGALYEPDVENNRCAVTLDENGGSTLWCILLTVLTVTGCGWHPRRIAGTEKGHAHS